MTHRPILRALLASLVAACIAIAAAPAAHAQDTGAAETFLRNKHEQVQRLLRRPANPARNQQLTRLLEGFLDYQALSEQALSAHWSGLSEEQRTEFVGLLRQLVERSYQSNLQNTLDYEVDYVGSEASGTGVTVKTEARSRTNRRAPSVSIDYQLRRDGTVWRVTDVTTDGSSMVRSYRGQFNRIITRDGWDGLMERMRARLQQGSDI